MARKDKVKKDRGYIDSVGGMDPSIKSKIIIICVIVCIFCIFYFITVLITRDSSSDNSSNTSNVTDTIGTSASSDEIVIGRSFSMEDGEYLVLYYDKSDENLSNDMSNLISTYNNRDDKVDLYTVNMNSPLNKKYVSDSSNNSPSSVSELSINGPTLIKFNNGSVIDYIEGKDNISSYLS